MSDPVLAAITERAAKATPIPWGDFPAGQVSDVTASDMRAAAEYFAQAEMSSGPMGAMAAVLAADRATVQARDAERIRGVFGDVMAVDGPTVTP